MQNEKIIALVQKRLQNNQLILSIEKIVYLSKSSKKLQDFLMVTNQNLIFIQSNCIKKTINLKQFKYLTLAILSHQLILHCEKQWIRIESENNVKIIGNILMAKQKFLNDKNPLMVNLQMQKNLQNVFSQSSTSRPFWKMFSNKKPQQIVKKSQDRESFLMIQVNQKNFIIQIGKKMYEALFKYILLYSNGAIGFRFDQENYQCQQPSIYRTFYWKTENQQSKIIKTKIPKSTIKEDQSIRQMLKSYKVSQYSQQVFFCIQTQTHFQVISPYPVKKCISCQQYMQQNKALSQKMLKTIFYQLYHFISDDKQILISISANDIHIYQDQVKISTIFCKIPRNININSLSPQELQSMTQKENQFSQNSIFKINLWKIGIILFELSYFKFPFPIDYLASKVLHNEPFKIHFPDYDQRTIQFQHFIKSLLCKDPMIRANKLKGQVRSSIINPKLSNVIAFHYVDYES